MITHKMIQLADQLDRKGLIKEADELDDLMSEFSSNLEKIETEIQNLNNQGKSAKEIAKALKVSERFVELRIFWNKKRPALFIIDGAISLGQATLLEELLKTGNDNPWPEDLEDTIRPYDDNFKSGLDDLLEESDNKEEIKQAWNSFIKKYKNSYFYLNTTWCLVAVEDYQILFGAK